MTMFGLLSCAEAHWTPKPAMAKAKTRAMDQRCGVDISPLLSSNRGREDRTPADVDVTP
jgi:hypothetical protein